MPEIRDDTGARAAVPRRVRRVVSLVPSLTEALAATGPGLLVGATDWCSHPAGLEVARVRGTKNPDTGRIAALRPDLVLANFEENRASDLQQLRESGIAVYTTAIRTVGEALASLERMLTRACGLPRPEWLDAARDAWDRPAPRERRSAVIPIWRRPWMAVGCGTFAGDVLHRLGIDNVLAGHAERYPKIRIEELNALGADLVVLPDEPYRFTAGDGPESFPALPAALVSGRHLTWYGPSLAEAPEVLGRELSRALP